MTKSHIKHLLEILIRSFSIIFALMRGTCCIIYYYFMRKNVCIRFPFYVYQKVQIKGPGSVLIDRCCAVYPNMFQGLTIETLSCNAKVTIGQNCSLGGLTIRCLYRITIGDRGLTASSLIQDCLFLHPDKVASTKINLQLLKPAEIELETNAWIAAQCCLLAGSRIGMDSVVALGTTLYQDEIKEFHLASGNPLGRPVSISSIQRMTRLRS